LLNNIIEEALKINWTRDVFDRLLVAETMRDQSLLLITANQKIHEKFAQALATSQLGCPWPQFNRPWKSHNNRQRKMPPEAGIAIGGVIGVIY